MLFNKSSINNFFIALIIICFISCQPDNNQTHNNSNTNFSVFKELNENETGIGFTNQIVENEEKHYFKFQYIYNGGGVAAGDINNDGLPDLYFTANEGQNKLYLNKGNLKFEDITTAAGVGGGKGWDTGTSMIDINEDGFLDIYVCRSGWMNIDPSLRKNKLFINQGDNTFKEQAADYGLADGGFSIQSVYLDYDNDGDIDIYLTNHPTDFDNKKESELRKNPTPSISDRLYRNNGDNTFTDVSDSAGIKNYGHGLGPVVGDVNNDGFTDIYIANDYKENDYLYINNGDGTFTDKVKEMTAHVSFYAMGADISDFNNDGLQDILTTEMLPEDYKRSKTNMAEMNVPFFNKLISHGYHYQYMHNSLQLNRGNGYFSEISQMAGIPKTDWSWACMISDLDNDGKKDIFIANGYKRDVFDRDYEKKLQDLVQKQGGRISPLQIYEAMPSSKIPNYVFQNDGDLHFSDRSKQWGLSKPMLTNGATLVDLDNDGDYEIVCNNLDEKAAVYKNMASEKSGNNYLKIHLEGNKGNRLGIGAIANVKIGETTLTEELKAVRGYQSCQEYILQFGLGKSEIVDKVTITWKDGTSSTQSNILPNQTIRIKQSDATPTIPKQKENAFVSFQDVTDNVFDKPFVHKENDFDDFRNQVLLPHKMSRLGPFSAVGDVNGDGLDDVFIGGAMNQAGAIFIQSKNGKFTKTVQPSLEDGSSFEDMDAAFFDADNDGDLDLYVVSGGTEFGAVSTIYQDRLYTNTNGTFERNHEALPTITSSGSSISLSDFDKDGDIDLLIGARIIPDQYPYSPKSALLINEKGRFSDMTQDLAPDLVEAGMITSAIFSDYDKDGDDDIMATGEWMPIKVFENNNNSFTEKTKELNLNNLLGWWNKIYPVDLNNDGNMDYVVGNLGLNYKFKASEKEPFHSYTNDFDKNGTIDIVLAKKYNDKIVPIRGKQCSSEQMPFINEKFPTYNAFADASVQEIIGENIKEALHLKATNFNSGVFINKNGSFDFIPLPKLAQISTVQGIISKDWNNDGNIDLLISGNMYGSEAETTRADSSIGLLLTGNGDGTFKVVENSSINLKVKGDTKDINIVNINSKEHILFTKNNDKIQLYSF